MTFQCIDSAVLKGDIFGVNGPSEHWDLNCTQ